MDRKKSGRGVALLVWVVLRLDGDNLGVGVVLVCGVDNADADGVDAGRKAVGDDSSGAGEGGGADWGAVGEGDCGGGERAVWGAGGCGDGDRGRRDADAGDCRWVEDDAGAEVVVVFVVPIVEAEEYFCAGNWVDEACEFDFDAEVFWSTVDGAATGGGVKDCGFAGATAEVVSGGP